MQFRTEDPGRTSRHPNVAQPRRWLLVTIADLQERQRDSDGDSGTA